MIDKKTIENVAKCSIAFNQEADGGGAMSFDKKFLSYYDNFKIVVVEETESLIKLKVVFKGDIIL